MLAHALSPSSSLPSIDPYSDELPPLVAPPPLLLSRQPHFYHLASSPEPPFDPSSSRPPLPPSSPFSPPPLSCAASHAASLPLSRPALAQPTVSAARSLQSFDSCQHAALKQPSSIAPSPTQLHLMHDWHQPPLQHEERKEADRHEHKEQLHSQQQQRVRDVNRSLRAPQSHQRLRRGRSKD